MPTWVTWSLRIRMGPLLACGRTIKFHFCRANVFELAIKQRFSPPSQRTTRPRRAALAPSRFLFTHQRTGFAVYTVVRSFLSLSLSLFFLLFSFLSPLSSLLFLF